MPTLLDQFASNTIQHVGVSVCLRSLPLVFGLPWSALFCIFPVHLCVCSQNTLEIKHWGLWTIASALFEQCACVGNKVWTDPHLHTNAPAALRSSQIHCNRLSPKQSIEWQTPCNISTERVRNSVWLQKRKNISATVSTVFLLFSNNVASNLFLHPEHSTGLRNF